MDPATIAAAIAAIDGIFRWIALAKQDGQIDAATLDSIRHRATISDASFDEAVAAAEARIAAEKAAGGG